MSNVGLLYLTRPPSVLNRPASPLPSFISSHDLHSSVDGGGGGGNGMTIKVDHLSLKVVTFHDNELCMLRAFSQ